MVIEVDLLTILIAFVSSVVSSAVSVWATWYFSRRHYTRTRTNRPITENDIKMESNRMEFRLIAMTILSILILLIALVFVCGPPQRTPVEESNTTHPSPAHSPNIR